MYFSTPIDMIDTFEQFEQNKKLSFTASFFPYYDPHYYPHTSGQCSIYKEHNLYMKSWVVINSKTSSCYAMIFP